MQNKLIHLLALKSSFFIWSSVLQRDTKWASAARADLDFRDLYTTINSWWGYEHLLYVSPLQPSPSPGVIPLSPNLLLLPSSPLHPATPPLLTSGSERSNKPDWTGPTAPHVQICGCSDLSARASVRSYSSELLQWASCSAAGPVTDILTHNAGDGLLLYVQRRSHATCIHVPSVRSWK